MVSSSATIELPGIGIDALAVRISPALTGRRGRLKKKELYAALRNTISFEARSKNGKPLKTYSENIAEVRMVSECPISRFEVVGEHVTFYEYETEIRPVLDMFDFITD